METLSFEISVQKLAPAFPLRDDDENDVADTRDDITRIEDAIFKFLAGELHTYENRQHQRSVTLTDNKLIAKRS